jgi:hypothetical protein
MESMAAYTREYPLFSLCGLNCGLCPRYHTRGTSKCPGCGGKAFYEKHPPCGVISCAGRHGGIEYCCQCDAYPCKNYYDSEKIRDSFITKQRQLADFEKAQKIGLDAYQAELNEKLGILQQLLNDYDDGRRKNFFCLAVNLLDLTDIKDVLAHLNEAIALDAAPKEKALLVLRMFQEKAKEREISLELRK